MIKNVFLFMMLLFSCKNNSLNIRKEVENKEAGVVEIGDTIKPIHLFKTSNCYNNSLKFYKKYSFVISNFYNFVSEETYNIDNDFKEDTIAIFTPLNLVPSSECAPLENEILDDRILIISMSNGKKFVFDNVITNHLGLGSLGTEFITEYPNGFVLEKYMGQSCFLEYKIQVRYEASKFFIQRIIFNAGGCGTKKRKKVFNYKKKKFMLEKYDRSFIDSLIQVPF